MRIIYFVILMLLSVPCYSLSLDSPVNEQAYAEQEMQYREPKESTRFKNSERSNRIKQDLRSMSGSIGSSQDAKRARNLLMLKEVLDFKMQDETLKVEIDKLKQNREFNQRLLKALNQLDNQKLRNRKNQEVMDILNDAGNRIYNSLAN